MAYAIALIATFPDWQDWIREELDDEVHSQGSLEYGMTYPALKRCLALMVNISQGTRIGACSSIDVILSQFEVLRPYTPVPHIARAAKVTRRITTDLGTY